MTDERWRRLRSLFDTVQSMPDAQRVPFLDRELSAEPELRVELDGLLASERAASGFLEEREELGTGSTVGPYRLLESIGEGGFAIVYLAEQLHPIRRRVALKLIKPGMDSRRVISRFESERQALALMDHPAIAQVFEAGQTDHGRPYFAMEYAPGLPITVFCDKEKLDLRARLLLFLQVCEAIQHAHQMGVIHRDIKPSNILVHRHAQGISPKVIDFGLVKALDNTQFDERTMTCDGAVLGTVGYMSPEQIGAVAAPVDTRSDIYSLGIVLYELLAGQIPFEAARLRRAAWLEVLRMVRDEDPPPMAVHAARQSTEEIASLRSTASRTLLRELKGEIEWITLRALEKQPERRYASASEFAADIRRHLAHEPVMAAAPSRSYRLRKYVRRHRVGVTAASFVLIALLVGTVASSIGFQRARAAERRARHAAQTAERTADFLVDLFHASSPGAEEGQDLKVRSLLDEGTQRIESRLDDDPMVRARLLGAMSDSYLNLNVLDEGLRLAREALRTTRSAKPRDARAIALALDRMANAYSMAGLTDSVATIVEATQTLMASEGIEDAKLLASCFYRRGKLALIQGELSRADSLVTLALQTVEADPSLDLVRLHPMLGTRGTIAAARFDFTRSEQDYLRALELAEVAGDRSAMVGLHSRLAMQYTDLGIKESALQQAQLGVDLARRIYASDHVRLADALSGQSYALSRFEDCEQAIVVQEEAVGILRSLNRSNEHLAFELSLLANLYDCVDRHAEAIVSTQEALAIYVREYGPDHFRSAESLGNLGRYFAAAGDSAWADVSFRDAIRTLDRIGDRSIYPMYFRIEYADFCREQGMEARAESLYTAAEAGLDSTNAGLRGMLGRSLSGHARLLGQQGRREDAERMIRNAWRMLGGEPETDPGLSGLYLVWAELHTRAQDFDAGMAMLQRAARCGANTEDLESYPLLVALQGRAGYPGFSSP